ncbi:MAG TPA: AAA family ATPase [Kouleothrix sp.]|nr:AAA family ATPase [Kouleothrix sp.]
MITISLAGKGSSGKSTLLPVLLDTVRGLVPEARVLVVDADPHMSGTRMLGISVERTLGQLRSAYERQFKLGPDSPDETREEFAERKMGEEALVCADGFDLLAMGHWELVGSQCTVNRVLERALDGLAGHYDILIVDNEAGVEHIGRYATQHVNLLLVVSQPDAEFLEVAQQIWARCREVDRCVDTARLLLNRVQEGDLDDEGLRARLDELGRDGLAYAGALHESSALRRLSRAGRSPRVLPHDDLWLITATELLYREVQEAIGVTVA